MNYRRVLLVVVACFLAFVLWEALHLDTVTGAGAIWPVIFALLVVLMLPEKRLQGDLFVRMIEALKGVSYKNREPRDDD